MLAELGYLRRNHCHTVRLVWISGKVLLVIIFCHIERVQWDDFGNDGIVKDLLCLKLLDHTLCNILLFLVVLKDRRAVLRADVRTLAVERGGIVDAEENIQQVLVRD